MFEGLLQPLHLIVIMLIVVFVVGANKLPEIGSGVGKAIKNFKNAINEPDEIDITPKKSEKVNEEAKK